MLEIKGKYGSLKAFAKTLDNGAIGQLNKLCEMPYSENARIRIMPDAHAGAGCVIGTTMTISDKIVPNMVGVDIGCGMECVNLGPNIIMDGKKLDTVIRNCVPTGNKTRKSMHPFADDAQLENLTVRKAISMEKAMHSVGTLGSGNHFIEISRDAQNGDYWLVIHSGSRNAGLVVAQEHQKIAGKNIADDIPYPLAWLSGEQMENYVHDMEIMQNFANLNRKAMAEEILGHMKWKAIDEFTTIHNYLDTEKMILRKGAVSAQKGERLLIPMNMRDGSIICEGLGNEDWNCSAPHGAGRLYSRTQARENLTLTQFKKDMEGIYSSCISRNTIDESPEAYKPMEEILEQIGGTVKIVTTLKPVYNYKAPSK